MRTTKFQETILSWHKTNRRKMPWRETRDPYKILVSEVMLHQTQVSRVLPKYEEFLTAFPTIQDLARASEQELLSVWKGLGYWRRALYLKKTAAVITKEHKGRFPKDPATLETLPGVGPYTARAVAAFAFNCTEAFIDTNIRRVYLHFFFQGKSSVTDKEIAKIAQQAVLTDNPREWHYALFDYGAVELRDRQINKRSKHYHKQKRFEGSLRSFRTKVMDLLITQPSVSKAALWRFLTKELREAPYSPKEVVDSLLKDNLIKQNKGSYSL